MLHYKLIKQKEKEKPLLYLKVHTIYSQPVATNSFSNKEQVQKLSKN